QGAHIAPGTHPRAVGQAPRHGRMRRIMHNTARTVALTTVLLLLLSACAAGTNPAVADDGSGFWLGLWHGVILPVTFIISLFTETVNIYEADNNGNWYDFGFVLGLVLFSGPTMAMRRR